MDLYNTDRMSVDWIHLAQREKNLPALVSTVMNVLFAQNVGDFLTSRGVLSAHNAGSLRVVEFVECVKDTGGSTDTGQNEDITGNLRFA
jgi:hypothetical protein